MEIMSIPLFDEDFYKLAFLFCLNFFFIWLIIKKFYFSESSNKNFLFTYFMISVVVFFMAFTLKKYSLDVGVAIGIFAIFGIIRFRTESIPIREMTYLFIVIGVSLMNAFANKKLSYAEIIFANLAIALLNGFIERFWNLKNEHTRTINYEIIENIKPENYEILKSDLEERTGIKINKIDIDEVDFLKDSSKITIHYYPD